MGKKFFLFVFFFLSGHYNLEINFEFQNTENQFWISKDGKIILFQTTIILGK